MPAPARPFLPRYAVGLAAVAVALLLRWLLWPFLGPELPFLFLWPAVMAAAWYGGLGPGLLATALATLAEDFFLIRPGGIGNGRPAEVAGVALFGLLGSLLSVLIDRLRRAPPRREGAPPAPGPHRGGPRGPPAGHRRGGLPPPPAGARALLHPAP